MQDTEFPQEERFLDSIVKSFDGAQRVRSKSGGFFGEKEVILVAEQKYEQSFFDSASFYVTVSPLRTIRADLYCRGVYCLSLASFFSSLRNRLSYIQALAEITAKDGEVSAVREKELERNGIYVLHHPLV